MNNGLTLLAYSQLFEKYLKETKHATGNAIYIHDIQYRSILLQDRYHFPDVSRPPVFKPRSHHFRTPFSQISDCHYIIEGPANWCRAPIFLTSLANNFVSQLYQLETLSFTRALFRSKKLSRFKTKVPRDCQ